MLKIIKMFNSGKSVKNTSNEQHERGICLNDKLDNAQLEFLKYIHKRIILKFQIIGANI